MKAGCSREHMGVQVRVWNIPEQKVVDYADVHEMVTAVAWDERGERVVVGSMKGKCRFYTCTPRTHALEYAAQIGTVHPLMEIVYCTAMHAVFPTQCHLHAGRMLSLWSSMQAWQSCLWTYHSQCCSPAINQDARACQS